MTDADNRPAVVGQVERPVRPRVMLTHKDLCALADAAARNGTLHAFPAVALEWAAGAQNEIERLRAALEVSEAATAAAVRAAQWQARTNAELNKLQDEVRKLRGDACRRLNDEFGA